MSPKIVPFYQVQALKSGPIVRHIELNIFWVNRFSDAAAFVQIIEIISVQIDRSVISFTLAVPGFAIHWKAGCIAGSVPLLPFCFYFPFRISVVLPCHIRLVLV
jgi:hypothetical protein